MKKIIPFSSNLRCILNKENLTVRDLAKIAGVSPSVAQSWLVGANPHDLKSVARIADRFGVSLRYLLLGQKEYN